MALIKTRSSSTVRSIWISGTLTGTIANVEAIDLNSSDANTLTLSQQDVIDLSADANLEFTNAAAGETPPISIDDLDNILIDGDGADTASISPRAGQARGRIREIHLSRGGQNYTVYNYVDGASVLASVAVDSEVTTNTS